MLTDVLSITLLQLAFGLCAFTLLTPSSRLSGGFFALHGGLALAAAALAAFGGAPSGRPLSYVLVACLAVQVLAARAGKVGLSRVPLAAATVVTALLVASRAASATYGNPRPGWLVASLLLGGLLFGGVVWAMNLGHWYLVARTLPFQLLARGTEAFGAVALARAAFAVGVGVLAARSAGPEGDAFASLVDPMRDGLFFWSRVLWGLLAPVAIAPFVVKTARMKSNQAATGLLYVAVVFVMVGELLATYLALRTGLPV